MSDMFGGQPPAPAPARRARRARATKPKDPPAPVSAAAAAEHVPADLQPIIQPPHLYGQVTLHDGRQVDSGSPEWRLECLASTLLQFGGADRDAWIRGYGTAEDQQALRLLIQAVKASRGQ